MGVLHPFPDYPWMGLILARQEAFPLRRPHSAYAAFHGLRVFSALLLRFLYQTIEGLSQKYWMTRYFYSGK
jgi:hypothetical protein